MLRNQLKNIRFLRTLALYYRCWMKHHSYNRGVNNKFINRGSQVATRIQFQGSNNQIVIEWAGAISDSLIRIQGNNNRVIIHEGAYISGAELWVEDNYCTIEIGNKTFIGQHSHLACTEDGSTILIGDNCMISSYVQIRTGDSHSITDLDGKRINPASSVIIGNHCWIGEGVKVLKGVSLNNDTVVSTGAIVTRSFGPNVLLGGIPAKVLKDQISWNEKRI